MDIILNLSDMPSLDFEKKLEGIFSNPKPLAYHLEKAIKELPEPIRKKIESPLDEALWGFRRAVEEAEDCEVESAIRFLTYGATESGEIYATATGAKDLIETLRAIKVTAVTKVIESVDTCFRSKLRRAGLE